MTETTINKDIEANEDISQSAGTSLRINVDLLDTLMNLAGELVLGRNQLLQGVSSSNFKAAEISSQRIDVITSELQEAIMRTRMQPISNILNKFSRLVRDTSIQFDKSIELKIEGKEVELDKTILETIIDPINHLVKNCVEHGIENPKQRKTAGKEATGTINLKAFHDAGQVNILVSDDGSGLDPDAIASKALVNGLATDTQIQTMTPRQKMELIFIPGFSLSNDNSDGSERGHGLDLVIKSIESLGGVIELDSTADKGTEFQIKLPLTLAIIPSQITAVGGERYAIPQVNLSELLRIPASEVKDQIEIVGDSPVVRLRGELLPLVDLADILGLKKFYHDGITGEKKICRRENIADRRSNKRLLDADTGNKVSDHNFIERARSDRRYSDRSALNIAVVAAGAYKYGLILDKLHDSEEIVVKPVGRHLKKCTAFAGATIMGDGKVALILDISNIAQSAGLSGNSEINRFEEEISEQNEVSQDKAAMILFRNQTDEHFTAPLSMVERIERIDTEKIEQIADGKFIQYRGKALPLFELSQVTDFKPLPEKKQQEIIVFKIKEREVGLMVTAPVDTKEVVLDVDDRSLRQPAVSGSIIIDGHTTLLVDMFDMTKILKPQWFNQDVKLVNTIENSGGKTILFAEDSSFFRETVTGFMEHAGFDVIATPDGQAAWDTLNSNGDTIDLVVTDLEMPVMDGFELTRKIKSDPKYSHLDVIALTSLNSQEHIDKGKEAGVDAYEVKLDQERLITLIQKRLGLI